MPAPSLSTRLVTARLVLRAPKPSDVPLLRGALRRNAEHLRPWSPAPAPGEDPTSLTAISKAIVAQRAQWRKGEAYIFLATAKDDEDEIVGRFALTGVTRGAFQNAYMGYWVDGERQRVGFATEALVAVTRFAFEHAEIHRVQAAVMPRNAGSARVLAKSGYRREGHALRYLRIAGRWEDHDLFAVTSEEWPTSS